MRDDLLQGEIHGHREKVADPRGALVGVNTLSPASSAAASSSGIDRSTFASCTRPSGPIVASMMTTPWTRADWAMDG
jgi:hypothetical protein